MAVLLVLVAIATALLTVPIIKAFKNYRKARTIGLPIVFSPFNVMSPILALLGPRFGPPLMRLPFGLGNFIYYTGFAFYWDDRYRMHEKYGLPTFSNSSWLVRSTCFQLIS